MNEDQFIRRTSRTGNDTKKFRRHLVSRFNEIDENIDCGHRPPTGFYLAEALLLQQNANGPVIECGCYKGGSAAKLSVVCKMLKKELHLIDSFQGLPSEELAKFWDGRKNLFEAGQWKGTLEEVTDNIKNFGRFDVCQIHEGWFEDIIHEIDLYPSLVFIDVDIIASAYTCIKHFWPRLRGDRFYTHEACFKTYMQAITDEVWWRENLNEDVPQCVGKVNGFYDAPALAYLKKVK